MKTLALLLTLLTLLTLSVLPACESSPIQKTAATTQGKQIGNTGVYTSGYLEAGGSVSNR